MTSKEKQLHDAVLVLEEWYGRLPDRDRAWLAGAMSILRKAVLGEK